MASKVSIANAAFRLIGAATINSFDESSEEARTAKDTFQDTVDEMLAEHPWNFAMCRQTLSPTGTAPDWEYAYTYNFPASPNYCLRVWEIEDEDEDSGRWKVEGRTIVTDLTSTSGLAIRFTKRVTDPAQFHPLFRAALSAVLADKWYEELASPSAPKRESIEKKVERRMSAARSADGQEGSPDRFGVNEWLDARN